MDSINTNPSALQAVEALGVAATDLVRAENRVSTGLNVATPADNGAVWSIAQNMRGQASAWQTVTTGLRRAQSIMDVAAAAAGNISNILISLKSDVVLLNDTSLDPTSRAIMLANAQQLVSQIDQVASGATFDGVNLLLPASSPPIALGFPSGPPSPSLSFSTPVDGQSGLIQASYSFFNVDPNSPNEPTLSVTGVSGNPFMALNVPNMANSWTGYTSSFVYGNWRNFAAPNPTSVQFDFNTSQFPASPGPYGVSMQSLTLTPFKTSETVVSAPNGATTDLYYQPMTSGWLGLSGITSLTAAQMISTVNRAITQVNNSAATIGSQQQMLSSQITQSSNMSDVLSEGVGNLVDANLARESARLQADQTKQNLAVQALSIANAEPQALLALFRNA